VPITAGPPFSNTLSFTRFSLSLYIDLPISLVLKYLTDLSIIHTNSLLLNLLYISPPYKLSTYLSPTLLERAQNSSFSQLFSSVVCIHLGYLRTDTSGIDQASFFSSHAHFGNINPDLIQANRWNKRDDILKTI